MRRQEPCPLTVSVGALLLGGLAPAERREFLTHLPECSTCRAEIVELAPLPSLLGRLRRQCPQ
jgi:hypothetical protein